MFKGSLVALITPMRADGAIDERGFASFIDWQIQQGTHGIVPVGTTGESPTLSHDEHKRVVEIAVEVARGRVPVIAGAGSNSTREAIELAAHAKRAGADATLVVTPYYNKPTQEGLFLHYSAIADAVARHPNIVGVKDATANLARPLHTRRACGEAFCQLSGEDHTVVPFLAAGGHGCISVTANVAPRLCSEIHLAWQEGRVADAIGLQDRLLPLHDAMFAETSPGPVKYAASLLGRTAPHCRLPLAPVAEATAARVRAAMAEVGLLN